MNTNFHQSRGVECDAILDKLEAVYGEENFEQVAQPDCGIENKPNIVPPSVSHDKSKWSKFVPKTETRLAHCDIAEKFHEPQLQKGPTEWNSVSSKAAKLSDNSSCIKPSLGSSNSRYYPPRPVPLPKLIDLHKKPSTIKINFRSQISSEPSQKKMKPLDRFLDDDDFELSQDDLNVLDNSQ